MYQPCGEVVMYQLQTETFRQKAALAVPITSGKLGGSHLLLANKGFQAILITGVRCWPVHVFKGHALLRNAGAVDGAATISQTVVPKR